MLVLIYSQILNYLLSLVGVEFPGIGTVRRCIIGTLNSRQTIKSDPGIMSRSGNQHECKVKADIK